MTRDLADFSDSVGSHQVFRIPLQDFSESWWVRLRAYRKRRDDYRLRRLRRQRQSHRLPKRI